MTDYLKTALLVSALNGKQNKKLADQLFDCMFGVFSPETDESVGEMKEKLDDFVNNYVVAVKQERLSTPLGSIIAGK